jgi:hypothetical protein
MEAFRSSDSELATFCKFWACGRLPQLRIGLTSNALVMLSSHVQGVDSQAYDANLQVLIAPLAAQRRQLLLLLHNWLNPQVQGVDSQVQGVDSQAYYAD